MINENQELEKFLFPLETIGWAKPKIFLIKINDNKYKYKFKGFDDFRIYSQNLSKIFYDAGVNWSNVDYKINKQNTIFSFKNNNDFEIRDYSNKNSIEVSQNSKIEISVPIKKVYTEEYILDTLDMYNTKFQIYDYLKQNNFNLAQIKTIYSNYYDYYKHILFRDKTFEYLNNKIHVNDLSEIAKDFEKKLDIMALQKAAESWELNQSQISKDKIDFEKYWIKQSFDYKNIVQDHFANKLFELQQGDSKLNFEKYFCKFKKIDDSYYVKKFYDADQMHLIRTSLNQGFNLLKYVNTSYNIDQMKQISYGLKKGLDVSIYAKQNNFNRPIYDWLQMQEIRWGLEEGLDISKYTQLDPHGHPIFDKSQMREILYGLKQGLEISEYTQLDPHGHPIFDWKQMEQIRKGLKKGLDISQYTQLSSKSSLSDFDKTPTDLQDSKVINEYNKSSHTPSESQSKSHSLTK
ncbi:hypothetical protein HU160_02780 [Metamycoplasma hominis]|uniref:hypothetical protein n=1 Tax=Metamycoplasma hominis TaxID=2098 RepID=UPI00158DAFDE|nr:hypothetical protein [Metamycoplasma hominis]QKX40755.1 hypothetical protein HU160_02780 [Metamycoplasma hominis]